MSIQQPLRSLGDIDRLPVWGRWLLAVRWPLVVLLAGLDAWFTRDDSPADLAEFAHLGGALTRGHVASIYATPWNQTGPLQLLASRVLMIDGDSNRPSLVMIIAVNVAVVLLVRLAFRTGTGSGAERPVVELLTGVLVLLWLGPSGLWYAHPVEIVVAIFWLAAGRGLVAGRPLRAGAWLGLAAAIAPWAILAVPMTILAGDRWRVARSAACALGVAGLAYAPFALSGHFELFSHVWLIRPGSLVHLVLPGRTRFDWTLRLVQGALSALACGIVAYRFRGNPDAQWLAPLVGVAVRILADPGALDYYWLPAGALVVGGLATIEQHRTRAQLAGVALLAYVTYAATALNSTPLLAGIGCFIAVTLALYSRPAHHQSWIVPSWRRLYGR